MIHTMRTSLKTALLVFLVAGMAIPVLAQGQSPTNPQAQPGTSQVGTPTAPGPRGRQSRFSLDSSRSGSSSYGSNQQGVDQYGQPQSSQSTTSRLRDRGSSRGESSAPTAAQNAETPPAAAGQPPKEEGKRPAREHSGTRAVTGGGSAAAAGGPAPGVPGAAGAAPVGPLKPPSGLALLQGVRAGISGTPPAGGPAAPGAVGGAAVSMQGQGLYEPVYQREVEYGVLPDVGEPMTLPGPMAVSEFLDAIHLATNWNILVTPAAQAVQLLFWIIDKKPADAMEVLKFHDIFYEYDEKTGFLRVMTKDEWLVKEYGTVMPHEFQVKYADVTYIESMLSSLLSGTGRLLTDQRTGRIYIWDMEDNLKQMVTTVEELDVPLQKAEFLVKNADLADIETVLSSMLSPNGSIVSDPRTGQLFVWDAPTILEKMEATATRLDVPVESRTFAAEYVNAEDLIDSLEPLLSERGLIQLDPRTNALVATDLPTRLDRMGELVKTLDVQMETRTWVIKYADLEFIADEIEDLIPDKMGQIIINEDVHQITITGLPARLDQIDELVKTWDIKRKQVLIEAFIVEVDSEVERQFGVNWSYFDSTGNAPIAIHSGSGFTALATAPGSGQTMSVGQLPYAVPAYGALEVDSTGAIVRPALTNLDGKAVIDKLAGNNLGVTLRYLDSKNKATILSSPRVVVQDSEEAVFENATRVPYVSATSNAYPYYGNQTGTGNNPVYPYYSGGMNRVEFIDVGTILSVLPRITEEANILLDISAEDSSYRDKEIKNNDQTSTVPEKTVRRAETQLRIHSGETVVLGGLRRSRSANAVTRTPLLGDLPLLGRLFRNPSRSSSNDNLLIFITTTIVDEFTHPESELLVKAEEVISGDTRHNEKDLWGRIRGRVSKDENEIAVSVGQSGTIYSEGKRVTFENFRKNLLETKDPGGKTVVLRRHPRAPEAVINGIEQAAREAGLEVEHDDNAVPLVPNAPSPEQTRPAPSP